MGPFMNDAEGASAKCFATCEPHTCQSNAPESSAAVAVLSAQSCVNR